jgi:hypothetical protein
MNHTLISNISIPRLSLKPFLAIRDFFVLLAEAFIEARAMELESRKKAGNW